MTPKVTILSTAQYRCVHCGMIVERDSDKQWIKSYCQRTGRNVRLQRLNQQRDQ